MADFKDWLNETGTSTASVATFVRPAIPLVARDPFGWRKKKKKKKKDESNLNESVIEEAKVPHTILSERDKMQEEIVKKSEHEDKDGGKSKSKTTAGPKFRLMPPEKKGKKTKCPTCGAKVDIKDLKKVPFSLQTDGVKSHICPKCKEPKED